MPNNTSALQFPTFTTPNGVIAFTKVKSPYGWLGNMSPYPVHYQGRKYLTTEALFQALRFLDIGEEAIADEIVAQKSPMVAKKIAKTKEYQAKLKRSAEDAAHLEWMRLCLHLKVAQHPELIAMLLQTGNLPIVEDCTKRPRGSSFLWGAVNCGSSWEGHNWLGKLWEELREELYCQLVPVPQMSETCTLSSETVGYMREILARNQKRPRHGDNETDREHLEHCFHQLIRFANLAKKGKNFRAAQFGLNLGRAQEILESNGGLNCWWKLYEPLIVGKNYDEIIRVTKQYLRALDLPEPSETFIDRE